jgi:hypothetical protein
MNDSETPGTDTTDGIADTDFQLSRRASQDNSNDLLQAAEIQALGKNLVSRLAMLFKTVRIHSVQNEALRYSVKILVEAANALFTRLGDYTLRGDIDSIFVNEYRIRPDVLLWDNIVHLLKELSSRGVGGINFTGPLTPVDVRSLVQTILDNPSLDLAEGAQLLTERLRAAGVEHVSFLKRMSLVTGAQALAEKETAMSFAAIRGYTELLVTWKAYLDIPDETVPDVIRARLLTAIQNAVDMHHDEPDWFLSTASFRRPDLHLAVRAVNSAILAIGLGAQLDFTRKTLMNLGMATMYASSGLRNFGISYQFDIEKGGRAHRLGPETYPLNSVKEILQTPALTRGQRDRILVAYEHRMNRDGSGYPRRSSVKPKHLFSEIVTLVSRYIDLSSDFGENKAVSATGALEQLTAEEALFDPRLLRVFIRMLGPFPIGSVVQLTTGEIAVVFRQAAEPRLCRRPIVKIVRDRMGLPVGPAMADLARVDPQGNFLVGIVRPIPPMLIEGLNPAQVVFAATLEEPTEEDEEQAEEQAEAQP